MRGYAAEGTPGADTVPWPSAFLMTDFIDFVVFRDNRGPNLGFDVFYSGTVAAAMGSGYARNSLSCSFFGGK